jgi:hypothetical protein
MTHCSTGAAVAPRAVTEGFTVRPDALLLDDGPELSGLIAEVDAILCEAAASLLRPPPSRRLAACALVVPRSPGRSWAVSLQPWRAPTPEVRAVQRGPPRATSANNGDTT